jgi:ubiquinol-cytochrome c reductase cytochrome b subunit
MQKLLAWIDDRDKATVLSRILTIVYFLFFLLMPWYTARDRTKPVPTRTT